MKLSNSFTIGRPPEEVYDAFLDIERVASCMPGSRVLGNPEPQTYDGEVKVKVGPLGVAYSGQFKILDADRKALRLTMRARGREQRGAGNADAHIVAQLSDQPGGTRVEIDTELDIRGKVAQFGRGVIGEVTEGIMQAFAGNVEQMLTSGGTAAPATSGSPRATQQPEFAPVSPSAATAGSTDLEAWSLIIRPMLQRHRGSIVTIALAGLAAYAGARAGARRGISS